MGWSVAGGLGGAAEVSGVPGLLSVVVRSMVGLLGEVVLVSIVLMLSMVVSGLSFVSVAVGANVGMTGSGSWSWGGSGLSWALRWLDGTVCGCAVWWYLLGCPEAGTVFPDGAALECRWCWDVDRAVLLKGLP